MTVSEIRDEITGSLQSIGISDAASEARIILRETAGISPTDIHARPDAEVDPDTYDAIKKIINRRLMREPLQYIYGRWDFMGLSFAVRPGVLIPRPDTEILVETALKDLHDGMRILDLCTGTGCILISLLKYSNNCSGTGVDISEDAVKLACENAERILGTGAMAADGNAAGNGGASDNTDGSGLKNADDIDSDNADGYIRIIQGDLYENSGTDYDIIISNPPYIVSDVIDTLAPEVKEHEPHLALDGGSDGLDLIRRIIDGAQDHLTGGGKIFLEIGYDQGESVSELMRHAGLIDVEVIQDYAGLDRVVCAAKPIL